MVWRETAVVKLRFPDHSDYKHSLCVNFPITVDLHYCLRKCIYYIDFPLYNFFFYQGKGYVLHTNSLRNKVTREERGNPIKEVFLKKSVFFQG